MPVIRSIKIVVAIPAVEDVLTSTSPQHLVVAFIPVVHVAALFARQEVFALPAVEHVLAPVNGQLQGRIATGLQLVVARPA